MTTVEIYHHPRCSKSRATLALLQERHIAITIIEYLKQPPSATQLDALLDKLTMEPMDLMRRGEDVFKEQVQGQDLTRDALLAIMVANPILIERPIVVCGDKAAIGRPPEAVLSMLGGCPTIETVARDSHFEL
ncbi:MAG: arsenate reductase (glutaredoxin) [Mariprofundaceae bacterium]|nr:arsenate reductase (glutaredoxin) [Mariprofundaceae bacterium]